MDDIILTLTNPIGCLFGVLSRRTFCGFFRSGRQVLPPRFLRHAPLLFVDSPAQESLEQIYGAFNSALLKLHPPLRGHLDGLTNAMIEFYHLNQVSTTLVPSRVLCVAMQDAVLACG